MRAKLLLGVIASLVFTTLSFASIAKFTALSGDVSIIESGKSSPASMSSEIDKSDKIVTGSDGKAQIVFKDNTVITLGVDSDFAIEEYFSDAKKPKASFSIGKGTFKALTGAMGKINPEGFKLKTKTATIGIRGTGILGQVTPQENKIACTQGAISVTSVDTGVSVNVGAGQITSVVPNTPPAPPRAYTPQEVNDIESSSGVGEMPDDTETQNNPEAETTEGDVADEEEAANEDDATAEGEATAEGDATTPEALPEATDIDTADSIAASGVTETDQTENFLQETAEALGVSIDELTSKLDGLTLEDLEAIEEAVPEGSTGGSGETYTYADDREEYLFGIHGLSMPLGIQIIDIDPSDTSTESILLKGYEFAIAITNEFTSEESVSKFSFPRTPVADSYVWSEYANIGTYDSSDSAKLDEIFGPPMGPESTWVSGFDKVYFDSKQEFFVYEAQGVYTDSQESEETIDKVVMIGKRAKWADKPSYVAHYSDVLDSSSKETIINFHNNTLLYLDIDEGKVIIGEIYEDSSSGAIVIDSFNSTHEDMSGYVFGSEFQGYGASLKYSLDDFPHQMMAGYRKQGTYTPQTFVGTLEGFRATDSVVELDMDINSESLLGQPIERLEIDNNTIDMIHPSDRSAYINNGLFATSADGNFLVTDMSDEYNSWGYWASADSSSTIEPGVDRGYWIAGDIENLIIPDTGVYNYKATDSNIQGHFTDGSTYESITSGAIDLAIDFGDGTMSVNEFKISSSSYNWNFDTANGNIDVGSGAFDGNMMDTANSASGLFKGQLYGDSAQRAAGAFNAANISGVTARGVFRADKQ